MNDVVYRIQQEGQRKFKVIHLDRLAKYYFIDGLPVQDEQAQGGGSVMTLQNSLRDYRTFPRNLAVICAVYMNLDTLASMQETAQTCLLYTSRCV